MASATTMKSVGERMAVIEQKVDDMKDVQIRILEKLEKMDCKFDDMNGKFAGKWVEKALVGGAATLIVGIAAYMIQSHFK